MKPILVSTDFSVNSKAGIRFALQIARITKAELIFYHIIEIMKPTAWSAEKYKKLEFEKQKEFTAKLKEFVAGCAVDGKVPRDARYIAETGTKIDKQIITNAQKYKAGFICMSTRGAGKVEKLFGTNSSSVVTSSPVPVIVVPKNYKNKNLEKMLYASDFANITQEMKLVLPIAAELKIPVSVYHYDYLLHVKENREKLEKKAQKLVAPGINFHFKRQEIEKSLSSHLNADIKKENASLLILFTKQNRNWFDRLFSRSESAKISFNASIPMIVFRKKEDK